MSYGPNYKTKSRKTIITSNIYTCDVNRVTVIMWCKNTITWTHHMDGHTITSQINLYSSRPTQKNRSVFLRKKIRLTHICKIWNVCNIIICNTQNHQPVCAWRKLFSAMHFFCKIVTDRVDQFISVYRTFETSWQKKYVAALSHISAMQI